MKHTQLPLTWRGIQQQKIQGHFCANQSWPKYNSHTLIKLALDTTLLSEVSLNFLSTGWHTFGLDSAYIFFSVASRNFLRELHLFTLQDKNQDEEQPPCNSLCSSQWSIVGALHIPNFPPLEGYTLIHGCFLLLQDNLLWKKEKHSLCIPKTMASEFFIKYWFVCCL